MRINEPGRFVQGLPGFDCIRAVVERLRFERIRAVVERLQNSRYEKGAEACWPRLLLVVRYCPSAFTVI